MKLHIKFGMLGMMFVGACAEGRDTSNPSSWPVLVDEICLQNLPDFKEAPVVASNYAKMDKPTIFSQHVGYNKNSDIKIDILNGQFSSNKQLFCEIGKATWSNESSLMISETEFSNLIHEMTGVTGKYIPTLSKFKRTETNSSLGKSIEAVAKGTFNDVAVEVVIGNSDFFGPSIGILLSAGNRSDALTVGTEVLQSIAPSKN